MAKSAEVQTLFHDTGISSTIMWARQLTDGPDQERIARGIFGGFFIIAGAIIDGFGSVLFAFCIFTWAADVIGGILRALHRSGWKKEAFDVGKALGGFGKLIIVMLAWAVTIGAEQAALEQFGVDWSVAWMTLALGVGVFLASFADQVHYFVPVLGRFLNGVAVRWNGGVESEAGKLHVELEGKVDVEGPEDGDGERDEPR